MMQKDKIWMFFMNLFSSTCHQKAERSFFIKNYQFPVCARCSGMLFGYVLGGVLLFLIGKISLLLSLLFLLIMFLDWFIQHKGIKASTNFRRFVSGTLAGIGIIGLISNMYIFIKSII